MDDSNTWATYDMLGIKNECLANLRHVQLDFLRCAFSHTVAAQLPRHDDRADFMARVDLIVNGVAQRVAAQR